MDGYKKLAKETIHFFSAKLETLYMRASIACLGLGFFLNNTFNNNIGYILICMLNIQILSMHKGRVRESRRELRES